ncbi:DUF4225 domain-containing protein [Erwinia pyrifoliae]|uniref:DUF4225 domain-containing protein n=1 Tax=Erwinia pyrifoliae TaxID=79967 RepID=A0ABY5X675_ERWPY|nr:DUF4225 domain-containing protein [Erwinia pyrifoliae]UWS32893.1 DUF4225 domain-containing protein [Erwinia pyrifoliae]
MFTSFRKSEFETAVDQLRQLSYSLSLTWLPQGVTRHLFQKEINDLIRYVSNEVDINCLSVQGGYEIIKKETERLRLQEFDIISGKVKQYLAIEKSVRDKKANLFLKQIGFVSGGSQVFAGFGVCAASLGVACATYGTPLIVHGMNNTYESGYYLLYRTEKQGYTRQAYREVAQKLGYSDNKANLAYASIDIALSGYGMARNVPKQDSWRLFNHINSDFIRGWQEMGKVPMAAELTGVASTAYSIRQLN